MRAARLKVFGWTGDAPYGQKNQWAPWASQVRCCVAARSLRQVKDEICCHLGGPYWPGREYISETWNPREVETAIAQPGVVFWRWLDDHSGPFLPWPSKARS